MNANGSSKIKAERKAVWNALHDPDILHQCIPACKELTKSSKTDFMAMLAYSVNNFPIHMLCKLELTPITQYEHIELWAFGTNALSCGTSVAVDIVLKDAGKGWTLMTYAAETTVSADLQGVLGNRLDDFSGEITDRVFEPFAMLAVQKARTAAKT